MIASSEQLVVGIASAQSFEGTSGKRFTERRTPLMHVIGEFGAKAVALNGVKDYNPEQDVFGRYFVVNPPTGLLKPVDDSVRVGSALDLTGGIAKLSNTNTLALNPLGVRELGKSKFAQANALREGLGEAIPATVLSTGDFAGILGALEAIDAEVRAKCYVVKPDFDPGKRFRVLTGTKDEIESKLRDYLGSGAADKNFVVQEYMEGVDADFDPELKFPAAEQEIGRALDGRREVRMQFIDDKLISAFGRVGAARAEGDEWLFFDPDSLPESARRLGERAVGLVRQTAGTVDSYIAVDTTPNFSHIIEVNTRNIGVIMPSDERYLMDLAHKLTTGSLASKLVEMSMRDRR